MYSHIDWLFSFVTNGSFHWQYGCPCGNCSNCTYALKLKHHHLIHLRGPTFLVYQKSIHIITRQCYIVTSNEREVIVCLQIKFNSYTFLLYSKETSLNFSSFKHAKFFIYQEFEEIITREVLMRDC